MEEETFTRWPTEIDGIEDATRLVARMQPCVLRASGEVACIGTGEAARLEINEGCAVVREGREGREVACWGGDVSIDTPTLTAMPEDEEAVEVSWSVRRVALTCCMGCLPSGPHGCARLASGKVACWGSNTVGQLGDGTRVDRTEATLVQGLNDARAIVTGEHHNCVIRADESAWCWGYGADGMLGDGAEVSRPQPVRVRNVDHVVSLSAGQTHTCAIDRSGRAFCWGPMNRFGLRETGNLEAVFLGAPERLVEIAAGDDYTCARSETGHVFCGGWY